MRLYSRSSSISWHWEESFRCSFRSSLTLSTPPKTKQHPDGRVTRCCMIAECLLFSYSGSDRRGSIPPCRPLSAVQSVSRTAIEGPDVSISDFGNCSVSVGHADSQHEFGIALDRSEVPHLRAKSRVPRACVTRRLISNFVPLDSTLSRESSLAHQHYIITIPLAHHFRLSTNNATSNRLLNGRGRVFALFLCAIRVQSVVAQQRKKPDTAILRSKVLAGPHCSRFRNQARLLTSSCWTWVRSRFTLCAVQVWSSLLRRHGYGLGFVSLRSRVLAEPYRPGNRVLLLVYMQSQGYSEICTVLQSPGGRVPALDFRVLGSQLR